MKATVTPKIVLGEHQREPVDLAKEFKGTRATILMPTSTGKTFVLACIILDAIIRDRKEGGTSNLISAIGSHRIVLTNQIIKEVIFLAKVNYGLIINKDFKIFLVHSGRPEDINVGYGWVKDNIKALRQSGAWPSSLGGGNLRARRKLIKAIKLNTLGGVKTIPQSELEEQLKRCNDIPVIIGTVYNSLPRVENVFERLNITDRLDTFIGDEAHYLTRSDFADSLDPDKQTWRKMFFFTATAVHSGHGVDEAVQDNLLKAGDYTKAQMDDLLYGNGMNNESRFGPLLFRLSERDAVKKGLMCTTMPTFIEPNMFIDDAESKEKSKPVLVKETFLTHMKNLMTSADESRRYENVTPKMLVTMTGLDIQNFLGSAEYRELLEMFSDLNILTVHSTPHLTTYSKDGISYQCDRNTFESKMHTYGKDPDIPLILINTDILAEGVDIQGLNGTFILRTIESWAKFKQINGRVIRPWRNEDREPDFKVKPHGHLYLLKNQKDNATTARYSEWLGRLYAEQLIPEIKVEGEDSGVDGKPPIIPIDEGFIKGVRSNQDIELKFLNSIALMDIPGREAELVIDSGFEV